MVKRNETPRERQHRLLHTRHPIELWSDRWNHTGAMIRTLIGALGLIGMLIMWLTS